MGNIVDALFHGDFHAIVDLSLEEIAVLLGGEVDGRFIVSPSPGRDVDDRSCCVRIDPSDPSRFFIYSCEGPQRQAYKMVRDALGIAPKRDAGENVSVARRLWDESVPAFKTVVETYLKARSISGPVPECIRYHGRLRHPTAGTWPAMVTQVVRVDGSMCGIHRTYLRFGGQGKANIEPNKMTLGTISGGCARLSPVSEKLVVGEGIETTLSAMQILSLPGWAALSTTGMKAIVLPRDVRSVVIAADVDERGWGEMAARAAARRFAMEGRDVTIARPQVGNDFNDVIRAQVRP